MREKEYGGSAAAESAWRIIIQSMYRLNHLGFRIFTTVCTTNVSLFGPKILAIMIFNSSRFRTLLRVFDCAFTLPYVRLRWPIDRSECTKDSAFTLPDAASLNDSSRSPVDLAKICYVDGDLFSSRSCAPIPPMVIKEDIHNSSTWQHIMIVCTRMLAL
jgi:hypothetical protein